MSWILNKKKQILKIITKQANKCSVIFFSIPKYSFMIEINFQLKLFGF